MRILPWVVCVFGGLISMSFQAWADDEASAWASFQAQVQAANPRLVQETFQRSHTNSPSPQEFAKITAGLSAAETAVMDQAGEFQKHFPQGAHQDAVRQALAEMLGRNFGSMGFPIPKDRVAVVEACTRKFLADAPTDLRLNLVLCRVAARLPVAQARALYTELSSEPTPEPARSLAKKGLQDLGRLGKPLEMTFDAVDGRTVRMADLKGKVVLIDFWSTDCAPCLREMPDLNRLLAKYEAQGLELVGITLDSDRQTLQRCLEKQKISWPQYYDPAGQTNRLVQQFGITSTPVVWLVDRHGLLRDLSGGEDQEAKLQALLKEP
jgi:peroxiredoxin